MKNKNIKLIANDAETVHFLSALLQEGVSCNAWLLFKDNKLKILIDRICWEEPKEVIGNENHILRLHSIVSIHNVIKVKMKGISKKKINFFSILSIICDHSHNKSSHNIKILLSKGIIDIDVGEFLVTMKDISSHWLSSSIPEDNIENNQN